MQTYVTKAEEFVNYVKKEIKEFGEFQNYYLLPMIKRQNLLVKLYSNDLQTYIGTVPIDWNKVHYIERHLDYFETLINQELYYINDFIRKHKEIDNRKEKLIEEGKKLMKKAKIEIHKFGDEDDKDDIDELKDEVRKMKHLMEDLDKEHDYDDKSIIEDKLERIENSIKNLLDKLQKQHTTPTPVPITTTSTPIRTVVTLTPTTQKLTTPEPSTEPTTVQTPTTQDPNINDLIKVKHHLLIASRDLVNFTNSILDHHVNDILLRSNLEALFIEDLIVILKDNFAEYADFLLMNTTLIKHENNLKDQLKRVREYSYNPPEPKTQSQKQQMIIIAEDLLNEYNHIKVHVDQIVISIREQLQFIYELMDLLEKIQNDDIASIEFRLSFHDDTLKQLLNNFIF